MRFTKCDFKIYYPFQYRERNEKITTLILFIATFGQYDQFFISLSGLTPLLLVYLDFVIILSDMLLNFLVFCLLLLQDFTVVKINK